MSKPHWYMISTISGKEDTAISLLKHRIKNENLQEFFEEIIKFDVPQLVPKSPDSNETKIKEVNLFKGYFFIKMQMVDQAWYVVRNTQYITGLIGSHGKGAKPTPISDRQYEKMKENWIKKLKQFKETNGISLEFEVDDYVKVISGPFRDDIGQVIKIENNKTVARVRLDNIFGRSAEVDFPVAALEKINVN